LAKTEVSLHIAPPFRRGEVTLACMLGSLAHEGASSLVLRRPIPGVTVVRFAGERPLMRAVPEHYGTTTQLAGHSHWTSGGVQWSSAPGSVGIKVPGQVVVERAREGRLDFHAVLFDTALVHEALATLDRSPGDPRPYAIEPGDPRAQPLLTLHRHLLDDEPAHVLAQATCDALHALVDVMGAPRGRAPERRAACSAAVMRARQLLDERLTETVDLEALAAHARLDKFRLCRAFSEEVGIPPHAYVTHRRVALAAVLLARGVPQAEVASRVGFYDQSLLHRHFKRILRLTPGEFVRGH
jgi:AraC-like DNA-binding protein